MTMNAVLKVLLAAAMVLGRRAAEPCASNPRLVGKCFVVHGRLSAYNGNPTFRVWRVGTTRILGLAGPNPGDLVEPPEGLTCKAAFDCDTYADFLICPFSKEEAGVMQRVCIESAKNVRIVRKNP
jgi:hypothetical protein